MRGRSNPAQVFAALGDGTRLRLLDELASSGPLSITRLSAGKRVTRQAITKHLRMLERVGLVRAHAHGRERRWELDAAELAEAQAQLATIAAGWDRRLAKLKKLLEG